MTTEELRKRLKKSLDEYDRGEVAECLEDLDDIMTDIQCDVMADNLEGR